MNSFKAVYRALEYEAERQGGVLGEGGKLIQETRGWVEERGITVFQRSKEYAHDYRYFPEPDLPPIVFSPKWIEEIRARLSELPEARRERFISQYGLPTYQADLLTGPKELADYFEACLKSGQGSAKRAKTIGSWLLGDFARLLNLTDTEINQSRVTPQQLGELVDLIDQGVISGAAAKVVFEEMFYSGKNATEVVVEKGLSQISDAAEIEEAVEQVFAANTQAVADFKGGKQQALTFLVGQVMRITRGRANPKLVNQLLKEKLERGT